MSQPKINFDNMRLVAAFVGMNKRKPENLILEIYCKELDEVIRP